MTSSWKKDRRLRCMKKQMHEEEEEEEKQILSHTFACVSHF